MSNVGAADPGAWGRAYEATRAAVEQHQHFLALVRAVAIDESATHMPGHHWLCRNSRTFGTWMTRGMPHWPMFNARAQRLAKLIATDLGVLPTLPEGEGIALVYGYAKDWVRARRYTRKA